MFERGDGGKNAASPGASTSERAPGREPAEQGPVDRALGQAGRGTAVGKAVLHTDEAAADAARSINAHAFTAGQDIYFGAGAYAPSSETGQQVISHEMTHVEQGRGVAPPSPGKGCRHRSDERCPVRAGDPVARGLEGLGRRADDARLDDQVLEGPSAAIRARQEVDRPPRVLHRWQRRRRDRRLREGVRAAQDRHAHHRGLQALQIGRASCRERV